MKKAHLNKVIQKQKQEIKILTNKPGFKDSIILLRKKWNIPENGIHSEGELNKWYEHLNDDSNNYIKSMLFQKRSKDEFNNEIPRNSFLRDIKKIVQKQKLSPRWIDGVRRYLLFNDLENMGMFVGPVINTKFEMEFETETLYLEIEANTTLDDVKAVWPSVMEAQSRLLYKNQKKFQPIRNFDRNKKAYELHTQGKKYAEIADFMSTENKTYGEEDIGKMIERYKKKVDIS